MRWGLPRASSKDAEKRQALFEEFYMMPHLNCSNQVTRRLSLRAPLAILAPNNYRQGHVQPMTNYEGAMLRRQY